MRKSMPLALMAFLLGCISTWAAVLQPNPTPADLKTALDLGRRGEYREALEKYQAFLSSPMVNSSPRLHAYVLQQVADAHNGLGDYAQAEEKAREAMRLLVAAHEMNTSNFATVEGVLAEALVGEGNYPEAKKTAERAVSLGKATLSPQSASFAVLVTALAHATAIQRGRRHAIKLYQQAVDIMKGEGESHRVELGKAYVNLAGAYLAEGNVNKLLESVSLALAIWKRVLPSDNSLVVDAISLELLGYEKVKAYREAEALVPEVLPGGRVQCGSSQPDRILRLSVVASLYVAEKKFETAAPLFQQALAICKGTFPPGHPITRMVLGNYSYVLAELGRTEEASRARAEREVLLVFPQRLQLPGVP